MGVKTVDLGLHYPIKRAAFTSAAGGDREVVAAVAGKQIIVLDYVLSLAGAGSAIWKSATTALSGAIHFDGANTLASGYNGVGCIETVAAEALNITPTTSAASGYVNYVEVPA